MKNIISIILLLLTFFQVKAQKIELITHRKIMIQHNDSSVECSVLNTKKKVRVKTMTTYYWYDKDKILMNQGGFGEKLLDGKYQVLTRNRQLITEGFFKGGTKMGDWKKWNTTGQLLEVFHWSKGQRNGTYQLFNNGSVVEKGCYKNDLLHGKQLAYQKDTTIVTTYKQGKIVPPKEKKEKATPIKKEKAPKSAKETPKKKEKSSIVKEEPKKKKND